MATFANPIEELKAIREELDHNIKSGIDISTERVDGLVARAAELTAIISRGRKSAETMSHVAGLTGGNVENFKTGNIESTGSTGGYLNASPTAIKAAIRSAGIQGVKGLVASGSSVIPVTIDSNVIVKGRETPVGILNHLQTVTRSSSVYSYLRELSVTNAADVVAAGGTKPTSDYEVESVEATLDVIAHLSSPVDLMLLEDQPSLERYLTTAMTRGIYEKIGGLAVAALKGTSGVQTVAAGAEPLASIYSGISAISTLGYVPGLIILHKDDYEALVTTRNSSGAFDLGLGAGFATGATAPSPAIFEVPVLISPAATAGQAIVLDTSAANISVDGAGIRLDWDSSGVLFEKNQRRARVETRAHVDVTSPAGIALVDLAA